MIQLKIIQDSNEIAGAAFSNENAALVWLTTNYPSLNYSSYETVTIDGEDFRKYTIS